MRKLSILFLLCLSIIPLEATISAAAVWDVQTVGSANNGCFFVTGASGMDYSQGGATVQATLTTLSVVNATTTKITVSLTDYTVAAGDVGNGYHNTGGSSTAGWYEITAVDTGANTWTLDRSIGTAGQTVTGIMGGSCASPTSPANNVATTGNQIYVKGDATYTLGAGITLGTSSTADNILVAGYTTTHGDGGSATFQATATSIQMLSLNGTNPDAWVFENFILDCNSQTGTAGLAGNTGSRKVRNVTVKNCLGTSIRLVSSSAFGFICERCFVTGQGGSGISFDMATGGEVCIDCAVYNSGTGAGVGFSMTGAGGIVIRAICEGNASATTNDCFSITGGANYIDGGMCYNAGRDCYRTSSGSSIVRNSIAWTAVGYCFNTTAGSTTTVLNATEMDYNGCGGGGTGDYNNVPAGANDVVLTVDPFTDVSTNDFSLNNTAGGGAVLRSAGYQLPAPLP